MIKEYFDSFRKPIGNYGKFTIMVMNIGHEKISKWAITHLKKRKRKNILDLGCGGGKNIQRWLKLNKKSEVIGLDYSMIV